MLSLITYFTLSLPCSAYRQAKLLTKFSSSLSTIACIVSSPSLFSIRAVVEELAIVGCMNGTVRLKLPALRISFIGLRPKIFGREQTIEALSCVRKEVLKLQSVRNKKAHIKCARTTYLQSIWLARNFITDVSVRRSNAAMNIPYREGGTSERETPPYHQFSATCHAWSHVFQRQIVIQRPLQKEHSCIEC